MSNGKELINELNYRQLIEKMPPDELAQFTAMRTYETSITLQKHDSRLTEIENRLPSRPTKKRRLAFGGTIVTATVAGFYSLGRQLGWWS